VASPRLVLSVLIAFTALSAPIVAAATIPDPTWITGVYDGGDEDPLLALVWPQTFGTVVSVPLLLSPGDAVGASPRVTPSIAGRSAPSVNSRAPPA
jgi:hypothetical protein